MFHHESSQVLVRSEISPLPISGRAARGRIECRRATHAVLYSAGG